MADYINMQQTEYDEIQERLGAIHDDILNREAAVRQGIQTLVSEEGGLYLKSVSQKVNGLMEQMEVNAVSIANNFSDSERSIADYIASVIETDVVSE